MIFFGEPYNTIMSKFIRTSRSKFRQQSELDRSKRSLMFKQESANETSSRSTTKRDFDDQTNYDERGNKISDKVQTLHSVDLGVSTNYD